MSNLSAPAPGGILAEVRTRDTVVRYRRSGSGRALLLLRDPRSADALWPELEHVIDGGFRVIVPAVAADTADVASRLRHFLEGIGCYGVCVLAAGEFCIPALELALGGREQVSRLLLVPEGPSATGAHDGILEGAVRESPVALRIVRRGLPAEEAIPLIVPFLAEER